MLLSTDITFWEIKQYMVIRYTVYGTSFIFWAVKQYTVKWYTVYNTICNLLSSLHRCMHPSYLHVGIQVSPNSPRVLVDRHLCLLAPQGAPV